MRSSTIEQRAVIAVVLLSHVVTVATIVLFSDFLQALLAAGWAFAVAGLLTIWGTGPSSTRLMIRVPLAVAGATAAWAILITCVPARFEGNESLAWAAALGVQITTVSAALIFARFVRRYWKPGETPLPISRFGLGALLAWIGLIAVWLGAGRAIAVALGWTIEVVAWQYFLHLQVIGFYSGCYTLLVCAALAGRRWIALRVVLAAAAALALGCSLVPLLELCFSSPGLDQASACALAAIQAGVLLATLGPLKWLALRAVKRRVAAPQSAT